MKKIVRARTPFHPAIQWTGDNVMEIAAWMNEALIAHNGDELVIANRGGRIVVRKGEWIVRIDYRWVVYPTATFDVRFEEVKQ